VRRMYAWRGYAFEAGERGAAWPPARRTAGACAGGAWNDAIGISSTNILVSLKKRPAGIGENVMTAIQTRSSVRRFPAFRSNLCCLDIDQAPEKFATSTDGIAAYGRKFRLGTRAL
jgi:hypothetical protein